MKNNNTFKRVAAGALAAISVAGYTVPANVGGFLNNANVLIADAAEAAKKNTISATANLSDSFTLVKAQIVEDGTLTNLDLTSKGEIRQFFEGTRKGLLVQGSQVEIQSVVPLNINLGTETASIPTKYAYQADKAATSTIPAQVATFYSNEKTYLTVNGSGALAGKTVYYDSKKLTTAPFDEITTTGFYTSEGKTATNADDAKFYFVKGESSDPDAWYEIYAVSETQPATLVAVTGTTTSYYQKVTDADVIFATIWDSANTKPQYAFKDYLAGLDETQVREVAENSTIKPGSESGKFDITIAPPVYSHEGRDDTIHTYKFNVPKSSENKDIETTDKGVIKISATLAQFDVINESTSNLREKAGWENVAEFPDSMDEEIEIKALSSSADIKTYTSQNSSSVTTITDVKAFQNEKIKITAKENFGAYYWNQDKDSGVQYKVATYDTNVNSATSGLYVLEVNVPYNTKDTTKDTQFVLTALPNTVNYSMSTNEDVLYATGSGYTEAEAAKITAKYTKQGATAPTTIDFNGRVPNETEVNPEIAVIPELLTTSEGKYWSATLTRNAGTDTEATVTYDNKLSSAAFGANAATNWSTIMTALKDKDTKENKVFKWTGSGTSATATLAGAGSFELAVTVYVSETSASGSVVVSPKTVKYAWSVDTKDAITASDIWVQAKVVSGASSNPLTQDNGEPDDTLVLKASPYGVLQIRANDKFVDGTTSVALDAGYYDTTDSENPFKSGKIYVKVKGRDTLAISNAKIGGFTRQSKLNDQQSITVKFTDPEYDANEQTITIPYVITDSAIATATFIGEPEQLEDGINPTIKVSEETASKLKDKIFDTYWVDGIDEEDVEFEYSEGLNKRIDVRELTWREEGLPTKEGNYTVFLNHDGEPFAAVNVEIAKHTMYFVPSEESLNITFGDKLAFKTDYTATDINGKPVKADMPEVEFEIYKPAYDEDGSIMTDEDGNPRIANTLGSTKNRKSPFYVANKQGTFWTYDKTNFDFGGKGIKVATDMDNDGAITSNTYTITGSGTQESPYVYHGDRVTYDAVKAAKHNHNLAELAPSDFDYDFAHDRYNAGTYVVKMKGSVNKNSGYVVEDQVFLLTIGQVGINDSAFVLYPATLAKNQTATRKLLTAGETGYATATNAGNAKLEVTKKYADLGLTLDVIRGEKQNNKISDNPIDVAPTAACERNFKNTVSTSWHIIKKTTQTAMTGLKFKDSETKLDKNGTIVVRGERPDDNSLTAGTSATLIKWGILYDNQGKLAAPTYKNVNEYKNLKFTLNSSDAAIKNAYDALQIGNGFAQTTAQYNTDTETGARVEMPRDTSIGVWFRMYALLSDGTIYYSDVKYVNITDEATYYLNLKMGDQDKLVTKPATEAIDNKEARKEAKLPATGKITSIDDKTKFRKIVQSGYNADDDSFFMYGSYTISKDNKVVTSSAVKQFGVIADTDGIYAAPTAAEYFGKDSQKVSVKDGLKLRDDNVFAVGKAKADNPVYDTDEYGLKIQRTKDRTRVTGVWARCYVDLGDGVVVYTDPVFIASTSDYYTAKANNRPAPNNVDLSLNVNRIYEAAKPNQSNWIINVNGDLAAKLGTIRGIGSTTSIKKVGVVVDNTGSLLTKDPKTGYKLKQIDGVDAADSRLILGAGYKQGSFNNVAPKAEGYDFMLPYQYDKDGDEIPFVAREFAILNIFGKEVTIYGNVVTNRKETTSEGGAPSKWEANNKWSNPDLGV